MLLNEKMLEEINKQNSENYLSRLKLKQSQMKEEINTFWQMQTPERVENLPSPPYVIVRDEDEELMKTKISNRLLPPPSTLMALQPLNLIMNSSVNEGIDNSSNTNVIDMNYNNSTHVEKFDFNEMAKYPHKLLLLNNRFLVNKIARENQCRFIESLEGTFHGAQTMHYLTTHREYSLKEVLRLFSHREEMPHYMMQVVLAVEQLHSLG
jgi:hypothetical protein